MGDADYVQRTARASRQAKYKVNSRAERGDGKKVDSGQIEKASKVIILSGEQPGERLEVCEQS